MDALIHSILHRNNMAIAAFMEHKRHRDALAFLRKAVRDLKLVLDQGNQGGVDVKSLRAVCIESIELPSVPAKETAGPFSFFNRALTFTTTGERGAQLTTDHLVSILVYNLGVLAHSFALFHGNSNHLQMALTFYSAALCCVNDPQPEMLLVLAIKNNSGYIHVSLMNLSEARTSFQVLERCVHWMNSEQSLCTSDLYEDEYVFFLETVFVFSHGNILITAPAA